MKTCNHSGAIAFFWSVEDKVEERDVGLEMEIERVRMCGCGGQGGGQTLNKPTMKSNCCCYKK